MKVILNWIVSAEWSFHPSGHFAPPSPTLPDCSVNFLLAIFESLPSLRQLQTVENEGIIYCDENQGTIYYVRWSVVDEYRWQDINRSLTETVVKHDRPPGEQTASCSYPVGTRKSGVNPGKLKERIHLSEGGLLWTALPHEMGRTLERNRPFLQHPMANAAISYPHELLCTTQSTHDRVCGYEYRIFSWYAMIAIVYIYTIYNIYVYCIYRYRRKVFFLRL